MLMTTKDYEGYSLKPGTGWQILGVLVFIIDLIHFGVRCNEGPMPIFPSRVQTLADGQAMIIYYIAHAVFIIGIFISVVMIAVGSIIKTMHHCAQHKPDTPCSVCRKLCFRHELYRIDSGQLICDECRRYMNAEVKSL